MKGVCTRARTRTHTPTHSLSLSKRPGHTCMYTHRIPSAWDVRTLALPSTPTQTIQVPRMDTHMHTQSKCPGHTLADTLWRTLRAPGRHTRALTHACTQSRCLVHTHAAPARGPGLVPASIPPPSRSQPGLCRVPVSLRGFLAAPGTEGLPLPGLGAGGVVGGWLQLIQEGPMPPPVLGQGKGGEPPRAGI